MKFLIAVFILISQAVVANIVLPGVLSDHMVLQQKSKVKLWGWASSGEKISIKPSWTNRGDSVVAGGEGTWFCEIETPSAGGPFTIELKGYNTITLSDILIGEVWLCSGQSNMEMSVNWGLNYTDEELGAGNKNIRFFQVNKITAKYPQDDLRGSWQESSSAVLKSFSAIACFFAQKLQRELKVPIGVLNSSWGGSPAEVWTPASVIEKDEVLAAAAAKLSPSNYSSIIPGANYNAMIHPLINYRIAGVLWYQGESNVGQTSYDRLLGQMIQAWRKDWNLNFPFYYAQIAPWSGYGKGIFAPLLRESQTKLLDVPKTGMILTSDLVNDITDIHPKRKKEVGERFANYVLAETYGIKNIIYKSPSYKDMKVRNRRVYLSFNDVGAGLISKRSKLTSFFISGPDKVFVPANALIRGKVVEVWNRSISDPIAVRYAFTGDSQAELFSKEGLPLNLFRTDDWDVPTIVK